MYWIKPDFKTTNVAHWIEMRNYIMVALLWHDILATKQSGPSQSLESVDWARRLC